MLFWIISVLSFSSCASTPLLPSLENRTLEISDGSEGSEFFYQYQVCVRKFVFCTKKEWRTDYYDLDKPEIRKELKDKGFKLRVME